MIETLDEAWEVCLELWKYLSEHRVKHLRVESAKDFVLRRLGYAEMTCACPMCEYGEQQIDDKKNASACDSCPIHMDPTIKSGCFDTPFETWGLNDRNSMIRAKEFYDYLVDLKKRTDQ